MARKKESGTPVETATPSRSSPPPAPSGGSSSEASEKKSWFQQWWDIVKEPKRLIGLLVGAPALFLFLFRWCGDSKTSVAFLGTDEENVIHLRVSNDGWKSSTLRDDYRLKFTDLPIEETGLELTTESQKKTLVPRRKVDFSKADIERGSVEIDLIVPGLIPKPCSGLTRETLMSELNKGHAVVEIEVEEANDPHEGPWHVRSDKFWAERLRSIVKDKIWFGGPLCAGEH